MTSDNEFHRGWRATAAGFLIGGCAISSLPFFTMGVLTKPLGDAFGWERGETQGLLTLLILGVLLGSPLIGWMADRFGLRLVTMLSICWLGVGFAALGIFTTGLLSYYTIAFLTAVIAAGTTSVTYSRAVITWFEKNRGLALGIAISGPGAFSVFAPSYATWLIENYGWRGAFLGLAILPIVIALPAAYFWLHSREEQPRAAAAAPKNQSGFAFKDAVRQYRFWCIGLAFFLFCFGTGGAIPHMIPLLTDRGLSGQEAARIAGLSGLAVLVGRIGGGWLLDRFWAPGVAALVVGTPALFCATLALTNTAAGLMPAYAISIGLAAGAEFDIVAYLVSRYFGMRSYGLIYGALYGLFIGGSAIAPPVYGWLFDRHGSYDFALGCAAVCFGLGALIILALGRYPRTLPAADHIRQITLP